MLSADRLDSWDEDERGGIGRLSSTTRSNGRGNTSWEADLASNGGMQLGGNTTYKSGHSSNASEREAVGDGRPMHGIVVSIREEFGFVKPDETAQHRVGDIFFHLASGLAQGTHPDELHTGSAVEFVVMKGRDGKLRAVNMRLSTRANPAVLRSGLGAVGVWGGRDVFPGGLPAADSALGAVQRHANVSAGVGMSRTGGGSGGLRPDSGGIVGVSGKGNSHAVLLRDVHQQQHNMRETAAAYQRANAKLECKPLLFLLRAADEKVVDDFFEDCYEYRQARGLPATKVNHPLMSD